MPAKAAACCKEKAVLVVVYKETSRIRRSPLENKRRRRHPHYHLHLHDDDNQRQPAGPGGGYSRRAELLEYSRLLRHQSSQSQSEPYSSSPKPAPTSAQLPPPPITQTIAVRRKPEVQQARVTNCLGNLKVVIETFLQPMKQYRKKTTKKKKKGKKINGESTTTKIKGAILTFQVKWEGGLLSKFLATLQKHK